MPDCRTGKLAYRNMRDAVRAADSTNRRYRVRARRGGGGAGELVYAYRCPHCDAFHVGRKSGKWAT